MTQMVDHMETRRPLLITGDTDLTEDILFLAAASGVDIHLATDAGSARAQWSIAPLVLIGVDRLADFSQLPRRRDVVVIARQLEGTSDHPPVSDTVWRDAIAIGAEQVVSLPDAEHCRIIRANYHPDQIAAGSAPGRATLRVLWEHTHWRCHSDVV